MRHGCSVWAGDAVSIRNSVWVSDPKFMSAIVKVTLVSLLVTTGSAEPCKVTCVRIVYVCTAWH